MDSVELEQTQNSVTYKDLSDGELVRLCQESDPNAFSDLVNRHKGGAMKVAFSILRDRNEAEDEVQNAFCKAFEHIGQFQREAKFSTWLTRIVVNQCLMRLRQMRRAKMLYIEEALTDTQDKITFELPDGRKTAEQELGQAEVAAVLQYEIRRTPPMLRNVFMLRDVEQRPMPEVAEALGITVAAAKSRLLRARAELRTRLSKHCGAVGPATLLKV